jgi:hypothetical protein
MLYINIIVNVLVVFEPFRKRHSADKSRRANTRVLDDLLLSLLLSVGQERALSGRLTLQSSSRPVMALTGMLVP